MGVCLILYFAPPASALPLTLTRGLLIILLAPGWSPLFFLVLPIYLVMHGHAPSYWIPAGFFLYAFVFAAYYRRRKRLLEISS